MRSRLIALVVPMLVLAMGVVGTAAASPGNGGDHSRVIVVLHDGVDARDAAADAAREHNAKINYVYEHALQGFAAHVPQGRLPALRNDARVASVRPDVEVSIQEQTLPTGVDRIFEPDKANTQIASLGIDGNDDQRVDVDVAVLDTGIDLEHPDLNVAGGVDCTVGSGGGPPWAKTYECRSDHGTGGDDDHYHGTHVAGTVGAIDNGIGVVGVAPGARLWAVKVLDSSGSGYTSGIVAGIDWVVAHGEIEVLNMSLGGSGSCAGTSYDTAISNAVANGVAVAVAAGNSDADAANYSPASCVDAFTVSALADFDGRSGGAQSTGCRTDQDDTFADFSNWGSVVDVIAPGVCILSTYPVGTGANAGDYDTISGTSMASPHAAGALALLASGSNAPSNATDVRKLYTDVEGVGNTGWKNSDDGDFTKEPLLDISTFSATFVPATGDTNATPTASFTDACTELSCSFDGSGSSDGDGTIASYAWAFGDGATATGKTASHTYGADGTYTVSLTVTDDKGASSTSKRNVTVSASTGGGEEPASITLNATAYKVKGEQHADLTWSGATSTNVDVYLNGGLITTTANDGAYTHWTGHKGGGSATYQVCEAGTSTCSDSVAVTW